MAGAPFRRHRSSRPLRRARGQPGGGHGSGLVLHDVPVPGPQRGQQPLPGRADLGISSPAPRLPGPGGGGLHPRDGQVAAGAARAAGRGKGGIRPLPGVHRLRRGFLSVRVGRAHDHLSGRVPPCQPRGEPGNHRGVLRLSQESPPGRRKGHRRGKLSPLPGACPRQGAGGGPAPLQAVRSVRFFPLGSVGGSRGTARLPVRKPHSTCVFPAVRPGEIRSVGGRRERGSTPFSTGTTGPTSRRFPGR